MAHRKSNCDTDAKVYGLRWEQSEVKWQFKQTNLHILPSDLCDQLIDKKIVNDRPPSVKGPCKPLLPSTPCAAWFRAFSTIWETGSVIVDDESITEPTTGLCSESRKRRYLLTSFCDFRLGLLWKWQLQTRMHVQMKGLLLGISVNVSVDKERQWGQKNRSDRKHRRHPICYAVWNRNFLGQAWRGFLVLVCNRSVYGHWRKSSSKKVYEEILKRSK